VISKIRFLDGEPEHEVFRKPIHVAAYGLVEDSGLHPVQRGQVGIEDDLLAADDAISDSTGRASVRLLRVAWIWA